jgi:hypothetical protein
MVTDRWRTGERIVAEALAPRLVADVTASRKSGRRLIAELRLFHPLRTAVQRGRPCGQMPVLTWDRGWATGHAPRPGERQAAQSGTGAAQGLLITFQGLG